MKRGDEGEEGRGTNPARTTTKRQGGELARGVERWKWLVGSGKKRHKLYTVCMAAGAEDLEMSKQLSNRKKRGCINSEGRCQHNHRRPFNSP